MDDYTKKTQINIDSRFSMAKDGVYFSHQPIYGYRTPYASSSQISRYMITKSILNALNKYSFSNFIDIGGAEGYTANLVKKIFNIDVKSTDLSENACKKAKAIFGIDAVCCDIHNLPFNDNEFDAVLCSETIEHVTDYKKAIEELLRITKKVLIITVPHETPEIVAWNIRNNVQHGHIHYFDTKKLDYLKESVYRINYEKTLSPFLIIPRVLAEGAKKPSHKLHFRIYNAITPLLKRISGIKTANWLTDIDAKIAKHFLKYGGITFVIEKNKIETIKKSTTIKARDFTGIRVSEHHCTS